MKNKIRIIFMGTPEFAVTILDKLVKNPSIDVAAVITAPDRPAGRGQKLNQSDVKKYAVVEKLDILQPTKLKDEDFISTLASYEADLFVVVAFRMLPEVVWNMPKKGTINLHGSLLPQYRGAAPINWAVINGDKETGVTTFFIEKEIDTGLVIEQESIKIGNDETAGELHDRLMHLGANVTESSVMKIANEQVTRIPQEEIYTGPLNHAPKIFKPDCRIDFSKSVYEIHNFVRGMSPYPTSWIKIRNKIKNEIKSVKIFKTLISTIPAISADILFENEGKLYLNCQDGILNILELQLEGKKRLNQTQFLQGFKTEEWEIFVD